MTSTSSVYKYVMDDVIKNIKHEFLSEGIPESVLAELQQVRCRAAVISKFLSKNLGDNPAQSIVALTLVHQPQGFLPAHALSF